MLGSLDLVVVSFPWLRMIPSLSRVCQQSWEQSESVQDFGDAFAADIQGAHRGEQL